MSNLGMSKEELLDYVLPTGVQVKCKMLGSSVESPTLKSTEVPKYFEPPVLTEIIHNLSATHTMERLERLQPISGYRVKILEGEYLGYLAWVTVGNISYAPPLWEYEL